MAQGAKRIRRKLARPLIQAGVERNPGETVLLRRDQIDRLAPEGYFENAAPASRRRKKEVTE